LASRSSITKTKARPRSRSSTAATVRDWWCFEGDKAPDRSKIAWRGENPDTKRAGKKLRLFLATWENPKPAKKVVTIDYVATHPTETAAAPFCVAMTGEAAP
jgi:hypothetical protein